MIQQQSVTRQLKRADMSEHLIDPESNLVSRRYAVVFTQRKRRSRFPENCVTIKATENAAIADSDPDNHRYPALVYGPSRSSEGIRVYYLVNWLTG